MQLTRSILTYLNFAFFVLCCFPVIFTHGSLRQRSLKSRGTHFIDFFRNNFRDVKEEDASEEMIDEENPGPKSEIAKDVSYKLAGFDRQ